MIKAANVDDYIAKAQPFAQPVLKHLRKLVHQACPQVEESLKWGFPHFSRKGTICGAAGFKQHCTFYFPKGSLLFADEKQLSPSDEAMGQFGRIASLADLPDDVTLLRLIRKAVDFNERGLKKPMPPRPKVAAELPVPAAFSKALAANKLAQRHFAAFTPGKRRDYLVWLNEAKTDATRERRLQTALEWIAAGKSRNWKYENC